MTFPGWLSQFFNDPNLYAWVTLPIIIFFARVCDVTLGTIRIIMVGRGKRNIAPLLGFCEVFIWIVAIWPTGPAHPKRYRLFWLRGGVRSRELCGNVY